MVFVVDLVKEIIFHINLMILPTPDPSSGLGGHFELHFRWFYGLICSVYGFESYFCQRQICRTILDSYDPDFVEIDLEA